MYNTNSFERYTDGEKLSKKYTSQMLKGCGATALFTILGMILHIKYEMNFLLTLVIVFIPFYYTLQASLLATKGDQMMRSAQLTYGSDEEEY